jgi:hypothetical protein
VVQCNIFAQSSPFCAVKLFGVRQRLLGEAEVAHVAAGEGRQVAKEGNGGFDAGVEGEAVRRVEDFGGFGVDLLVYGE